VTGSERKSKIARRGKVVVFAGRKKGEGFSMTRIGEAGGRGKRFFRKEEKKRRMGGGERKRRRRGKKRGALFSKVYYKKKEEIRGRGKGKPKEKRGVSFREKEPCVTPKEGGRRLGKGVRHA